MGWNLGLYYYHLARGGDYFGLPEEDKANAALVLPRDKGPIQIAPWLSSCNQYNAFWNFTASTKVELQGPYNLRITDESSVRRGLNTVLEGLDQGYKLLGGKKELHPDYGAPELAAQRGLKADHPQFTRWVLQSAQLRQKLAECPWAQVRVSPLAPDSGTHMVCVQAGNNDLPLLEELDLPEDRTLWAKAHERVGLFEKLDAMVDLLETVRDAVTAWPMPQTYGGKK